MPVDVDSNSADGSIFDLVIETPFGEQLFELAPALGHFEPIVVDLLEAMIAGEAVGAFSRKEHVLTLAQDQPGEADRCPRRPKPGDRAGRAVATVHDRGVEFDASGRR